MANIADVIIGILGESLNLFRDMAPYLLFGFMVAGILHVFISLGYIARHLGRNSVGSVIKSVVLGIPLPLCSCGVIPAAVTLKKKGASRGSVISFLIATPITGVDSIMATYSLLGLVFTVARIIAASCTAFIAGILTNIFVPRGYHEHGIEEGYDENCPSCHPPMSEDEQERSFRAYLRYTFYELMDDIWKWLLIGTLLGGIIAYAIPDTFIHQNLGSGWIAMLLMLVVGIPMYVCATGSIPIAAALMLKGMSPGAALVFLLAGPATNAITITVVSRELGKGATALYVMCVAVMSVVFGFLFDIVWSDLGRTVPHLLSPTQMLPSLFKTGAAVILGVLIVVVAIHSAFGKRHKH
jgi:uncharacterized membrane protein YraQ (UPF0718 family)